ncbi:molybdopterin dinucleotide binding domain-containing protein [Streptomyces sp. NPDC047813]|uniref:molybdopterin dinucleotide binding domain-containing protein n=1 Tax=Streptomyces sp. NPDC047813 TaxID=3154608 RepID=UPI0033CE5BE3
MELPSAPLAVRLPRPCDGPRRPPRRAPLTGGSNHRTPHLRPEGADRPGVLDGAEVRVEGAGGEAAAPAEVADAVRPGVVGSPHGWDHGRPGTRLGRAATTPGINVGQLLDESPLDPLSGNAVLHGSPVEPTVPAN